MAPHAREQHGNARQAHGRQQQGAQAEGMATLAEQGVEAGDGGDGGHGEGWHQGGQQNHTEEPSAQRPEDVDVGGVGGGCEQAPSTTLVTVAAFMRTLPPRGTGQIDS